MSDEKLLWKMGLNDSEFTQKLDSGIARVQNFGDKVKVAFTAVAGGAIAGAVLGFFDKVASRAGEIRDTADALELSTDSLQALDYTAKQAGVSTETLHGAFGILKGRAAEAAEGNQKVTGSLAKLGIDAAAFLKLPVDRQLEMIAKGAAGAGDKTAAFAAVADLIGNQNAPKLNAMLKQLAAEGLDGVTESVRSMGQVMSEDTINTLDEVGDRIETIKTAALTAGGYLASWFFHAVDGLGMMAASVVNAFQGIESVYTNSAAAQAEMTAKVEEANIALKGTKATSEEIAKAEEARAKATEAATMEMMTAAEKQDYYIEKYLALESQRKQFSDGTKEALKLETEMQETKLKLAQAIAKEDEEAAKSHIEAMDKITEFHRQRMTSDQRVVALESEIKEITGNIEAMKRDGLDTAAAELKLLEAQKSLDDERQKKADEHIAAMDRLAQLQFDRLTNEQKLAVIEAQRREIVANIEQAKADGLDTTSMEVSLMETENKLAEQRALAEKQVTQEREKQFDLTVQIQRIGVKDDTRLTDRELDEKINNLRRILSDAQIDDPFGKYRYIFNEQRRDLADAESERNLRNQFRREVGLFGEDRALQFHSAFDEDRLKGYIRDAENAEKTAKGIDELNQRLEASGLFPKLGFPK